MTTVAPTQFQPITGVVTPTPELVEKWGQIYKRGGFLGKWNIGRDDIIRMMGIAKGAQLDVFMVGPPGVGKTWLIELDLATIPGARLYDQLLMKDMSADDVLGFRSLQALKEDKLVRITDGFLPDAHVAYLDEWDKSNSTTVNGLLDITSKRSMKVGGQRVDCSQLLIIYFSGNGMPDREDLAAITDRLAIKKYIDRVKSPEQRKAVMQIQMRYRREGIDPANIPEITLDEWAQIKAEAKAVEIPDTVMDRMVEALVEFDEAGHPPTERKVGQTMAAMQMAAWSNGRSDVKTDDLLVAADMWWNHPDQRKATENIIFDKIGGFIREAKETKEALEPIMAKLGDSKKQVEAAGSDSAKMSAALEPVYELMIDLRRLKMDTEQTIQRGKDEGNDVSSLQNVLGEIEKADKWAQDVFVN